MKTNFKMIPPCFSIESEPNLKGFMKPSHLECMLLLRFYSTEIMIHDESREISADFFSYAAESKNDIASSIKLVNIFCVL